MLLQITGFLGKKFKYFGLTCHSNLNIHAAVHETDPRVSHFIDYTSNNKRYNVR